MEPMEIEGYQVKRERYFQAVLDSENVGEKYLKIYKHLNFFLNKNAKKRYKPYNNWQYYSERLICSYCFIRKNRDNITSKRVLKKMCPFESVDKLILMIIMCDSCSLQK